ncbi:hypothetical protein K440DRAFT_662563 [Wilcoxina mikolae CBS 423.85]|nr:hypothetical protein K440DRAFT_662563 [Wilcoxina mikolae CBS 423.85]
MAAEGNLTTAKGSDSKRQARADSLATQIAGGILNIFYFLAGCFAAHAQFESWTRFPPLDDDTTRHRRKEYPETSQHLRCQDIDIDRNRCKHAASPSGTTTAAESANEPAQRVLRECSSSAAVAVAHWLGPKRPPSAKIEVLRPAELPRGCIRGGPCEDGTAVEGQLMASPLLAHWPQLGGPLQPRTCFKFGSITYSQLFEDEGLFNM